MTDYSDCDDIINIPERAPTFAEVKKAFEQRDRIFARARERRNEALAALQAACEHATVVGGNEEYGDVDWRVCVTCGLDEIRGYEGGDEYNYGYRTPFKKLPAKRAGRQQGTRAYKPDSDKDRWRFERHKV